MFATMQSQQGKRLLAEHKLAEQLEKDPSIVLFEPTESNTKYEHFLKSTAALRIGQNIDGVHWRVLGSIFMFVPKFFRDWIYETIAENRYKYTPYF